MEQRGRLLEEEETETVVEMIEAGGQGISRRVLLIGAGGVAGAATARCFSSPGRTSSAPGTAQPC